MNRRKITGDVVAVQQNEQVVINRGERDGVESGQRYIVYAEGETLFDPETGERLGPIELVCGYGTVNGVQTNEATLKIDAAQQETHCSIDTTCHVRRIAYEWRPGLGLGIGIPKKFL